MLDLDLNGETGKVDIGRLEAEIVAPSGVICSEMEASALYTVSSYRGVKCASIFYVTDIMNKGEWDVQAKERPVEQAVCAVNDLLLTNIK